MDPEHDPLLIPGNKVEKGYKGSTQISMVKSGGEDPDPHNIEHRIL